MTVSELSAAEVWFGIYTAGYREMDGMSQTMFEQKFSHSLRVAELAAMIAGELGWPLPEQRLAKAIGLVHDIGRFPQLAKHDTMADASSFDHGMMGLRVLQSADWQETLAKPDWRALCTSVRDHNNAQIPLGLDERDERFLRLIRDADKLDIMAFVLESIERDGFVELPRMLPHVSLDWTVSARVLDEALETRSVATGRLRSMADFVVMLGTWIYDLNYQPTRRLARDRRLLEQFQDLLPEGPQVDKLFQQISQYSLEWLQHEQERKHNDRHTNDQGHLGQTRGTCCLDYH